MSTHPVHTVDVFARGRHTGNQLAVVRRASDFESEEMQRIALEMNYSETTFIRGTEPGEDGYRVRIYTPQAELPFAGHPTLGTAYVVREYVADGAPDTVVLDLDVGPIPVTVKAGPDGDGVYWMDQVHPVFGETIDAARAAELTGLGEDRIDADHVSQVVSTGVPTLLVPLTSLEAVRDAAVNDSSYEEFVADREVKAVLVFAPETINHGNDLHVRMFAPALGVPEDPATGSSNGSLAGYLSHYKYFESPDVEATVEQGYEIDRPSLLYLEARGGEDIDVSVGGRVSPVIEGELL